MQTFIAQIKKDIELSCETVEKVILAYYHTRHELGEVSPCEMLAVKNDPFAYLHGDMLHGMLPARYAIDSFFVLGRGVEIAVVENRAIFYPHTWYMLNGDKFLWDTFQEFFFTSTNVIDIPERILEIAKHVYSKVVKNDPMLAGELFDKVYSLARLNQLIDRDTETPSIESVC
jgi:hypothetical protein